MNVESLLVISLSVSSTFSAGLAVERTPTGLPRARFALVVAANLVLVPAIAWLVTLPVDMGVAAIGILVTAAAPGGATGPLMALLARGEPTLAARLFAVLTLVGLVTTVVACAPFYPPEQIARAALPVVLGAALAPLVAGIGLRRRLSGLAMRTLPWAKKVSMALLVATVVVLTYRHIATVQLVDLGVATVVALASFAIGLFGRNKAETIAIAQVSATRNLTLALLVLGALGSDGRAIIACLGYGLVMLILTVVVAVAQRRAPLSPNREAVA